MDVLGNAIGTKVIVTVTFPNKNRSQGAKVVKYFGRKIRIGVERANRRTPHHHRQAERLQIAIHGHKANGAPVIERVMVTADLQGDRSTFCGFFQHPEVRVDGGSEASVHLSHPPIG